MLPVTRFFRICKAIYSNIYTCAILFVVAGQFGGKCISNSYKHKFKIPFCKFSITLTLKSDIQIKWGQVCYKSIPTKANIAYLALLDLLVWLNNTVLLKDNIKHLITLILFCVLMHLTKHTWIYYKQEFELKALMETVCIL